MPGPYTLRPAGEQELEDALRVVQASYNLDPEWSGCAKHIDEVVLPGVRKAFSDEATCLFLLHGNRVIAASAYDPNPADGALLHATLEALRARGLQEAVGQTRPGTPSAKFLCTKFGGKPTGPVVAAAALVNQDAVAA
jgi:hypothetical protein